MTVSTFAGNSLPRPVSNILFSNNSNRWGTSRNVKKCYRVFNVEEFKGVLLIVYTIISIILCLDPWLPVCIKRSDLLTFSLRRRPTLINSWHFQEALRFSAWLHAPHTSSVSTQRRIWCLLKLTEYFSNPDKLFNLKPHALVQMVCTLLGCYFCATACRHL